MASDNGDDVGEDEIDLAEDALPPEPKDAIPIKLEKLFPWHRPRKQKVRQDQWVGLADTLIERLKSQNVLVSRAISLPDGTQFYQPPEIRYLTLPGLDYLDVRLIGEMCAEKQCALTAVGFLSDAHEAPLMARARVRETGLIQAGYITDTSVTFPRSLESICSADGATLNELKRRAPFHVVNIDACGSIAPARAKHSGRMIDAIYRLIELQLSRATHRWLFFLTVDVRNGDMDTATFQSLCDAIRENARLSGEFQKAAISLFKPDAAEIDEAIAFAKGNSGRSLLDLFSLGFSKWLLHLAQQKQWSLKLKKSHCYSTRPMDNPEPSMCSLAFEFVPPAVGLPDPFGVTRQRPSPGGPAADPSMQIVAAAAEIDDLDALLNQDAQLSATLNSATHALLSEMGYEISALAPLVEPVVEGQPTPPHRFPDLLFHQKEN
ncbi:hypothetical protein SAMN04244548_04769 [Paracoccus pantotrophus]|nr:hypothetical protein SAMN04244548_04769 [Paracoccus pantotrophus]